jgi:hypothetical protein
VRASPPCHLLLKVVAAARVTPVASLVDRLLEESIRHQLALDRDVALAVRYLVREKHDGCEGPRARTVEPVERLGSRIF